MWYRSNRDLVRSLILPASGYLILSPGFIRRECAARRDEPLFSYPNNRIKRRIIMKKFLALLLALIMALSVASIASAEDEVDTRPRTIVTTDLECDDIDSLLHLLLYANDIDIAAIIVTSSTHHWTGDGEHTMSEVIDSFQKGGDLTIWRAMEVNWVYDTIRNEYAAVYPNLVKHDARYPSPGELVEKTKIGNVQFEGDYRFDTEGSDFIKGILLDDDMRPLYVQAWGGANSLARALKSIEEEYKDTDDWDAVYGKVCQKTTLISWGNQDKSYADYIAVAWPDMGRKYCVTGGIGYNTSINCTIPYREYFKPAWLTENIKFNHGPLMGKYLLFGDGTYYEGENPDSQFGFMSTLARDDCWLKRLNGLVDRYEFISEGDSPCWMYLIPVGLRGLENSEYGSWGGRITNEYGGRAISEYDPTTGRLSSGYSVHRWFPAFMNDWAARADWCVTDFDGANHQPMVCTSTEDVTVPRGTTVELNGFAEDPDGDGLTFNWWVYKDASVYSGANLAYLDVWAHGVASTSFTVPADAEEGDYFNLVLEVTDNGSPALTRYAQVIITTDAVPEGGDNGGSSGG